jgi:TonB-linked SusC/RagA family outer membrane protein
MKKNVPKDLLLRISLKKLSVIMRLTIFLLMFTVLQSIAVTASSQSSGLTLNVKTKVEQILLQIENQTNYVFLYNKDLIDVDKVASINVKGASVEEVLEILFEGSNVNYKMVGRQIVLSPLFSQAQQRKITGKVTDSKGEPLPGVSIIVKGTANGTITNVDGNYELGKVDDSATLVFSFVGMTSQEIRVQGRTALNVVLEEETKGLDEVIVIGYGTAKRQDFTGSVASVKMENSPIANEPNMNALEAIKGSVPGLDVGAVNSAGGTPSIQIRGQKSISGSNSPLIVLDGVIFMGSLNQINPNDIASYDVLKDATSAAAYGSRSANGVIVITTKKGKSGKPMININASVGVQTWPTKPEMQTPEQWIQTVLDRNKTTDMSWMTAQLKANMEAGNVTDWLDLSTHTGIVQDYQASISGANEKMNYYLSSAYSKSRGVVIGDDFNRSTILGKISADITSWLQTGVDAAYTFAHYSGARANLTTAMNLGPYSVPYRDEAKRLLEKYPETQSQTNPLWDVLGDTRDNLDKRNNVRLNAFAVVKCPWIKGLSYRVNYSATLSKDQTGYFLYERSYVPEGPVTDAARYSASTYKNLLSKANGSFTNNTTTTWLIDNILSYKNTFGKHSVDLTVVATRDYSHYEYQTMTGSDFTANGNTLLGIWGLAKATTQKLDIGVTDRANIGYFGRANYSFNDKYFLTTSYRRDGASVFGSDKKWGDFAAAGLGWKISNEEFFVPLKQTINSLKLKASFGMNGNQGLDPYGTLSTMASGSSGGIRYEFGSATINYGLNAATLGNPALGWEKTESWNFGFESAWLNDRLSIDVDVYVSQTKDQIFQRNIPVMTGFSSMKSSMGQVNNSGVELNIRSTNIKTKHFKWNTGYTFWLNRNKLVHLYGDDIDKDGKEDDDIGNSRFIGKPLGAIYGYKQDGIVQTSDTEYMALNGVTPGTPKYVNLDNDPKITSADRMILGYSSPNFKMNLSNTLEYKNWQFYMMISGVFGGGPGYYQTSNAAAFMAGGTGLFASNSIYIPYWTDKNPTNKYPAATFAGDGRFLGLMRRDFIRIQDISLSYNFKQGWIKKMNISNLNVFVSAKNLATFTNWVGGDPEVGVTVRSNTLSALTSYNLGINVTF